MIEEETMKIIIPIPDEAEEMEHIQEELINEGFPITAFKTGGVFYHLLRILITIYIEILELSRTILNACFIKHAAGDWLEIKAADFSKSRNPAKKTKGWITIYRDEYENAIKITKGHCFKTAPDLYGNELKYYVIEDTVIGQGVSAGKVLVEAEKEGTAYNIPPDKITVSMIHLEGVSHINNDLEWIWEEGAEAEDLEKLRERILSSWSELADRTIEEKLRNAVMSVPGVLYTTIDAQHPRGQGTVDIIITGTAGTASSELLRQVTEAIEPLKGNYENYLVKSSETVPQDFEIEIYISSDVPSEGKKEQAENIISDMMQLTRKELNILYRDSIIQALSNGIEGYKKSNIILPNTDIELPDGKVIISGNINITILTIAEKG